MATDVARSDLLLTAALEYASYGWRVVKCHRVSAAGVCGCYEGKACTTPGKHPIETNWQEFATCDPKKIERQFSEWDGNIGIQLGPSSGIIDIECDSPEAETLLLKLFKEDVPVTPTWKSGRGKHRLFQWRPDLPNPEKGKFELGKLEFRTGNGGKSMQSIVPPSRHHSGIECKWLVSPEDCPVAELSQFAFAAIWNATPEDLLNKSVGESKREPCKDVFERARRYLAKLPAAVSGDGGSRPTYRAACVLILGFNFTIDQAYPLLEEYSSRCVPPWSESELMHKLEDAEKEDGERGYLLERKKVAAPMVNGVRVHEPEAAPDFAKMVHREACSQWREQFMLRGARAFDDPEVQAKVYQRVWAFNAAFCQNALDNESVQDNCVKGMEFIRSKATEDEDKAPSLTTLGLEYRNGEWWPGQWRVETINSDPPRARLYAPFLPDKFVEMLLSDFDEPRGSHRAILCATRSICLDDKPGFWQSVWNGQRGNKKEGILPTVGLKVKLLQAASDIEAPEDSKIRFVMAESVLGQISHARNGDPQEHPHFNGRPTKMADGSIAFKFAYLWGPLAKSDDRIKRNDFSAFLSDIGVESKAFRCAKDAQHGKVRATEIAARFKVITNEALRELERIVSL